MEPEFSAKWTSIRATISLNWHLNPGTSPPSAHTSLVRYRRLNFGISSAAVISQNVIRDTLEDIDGAINISDDILVFRKTLIEHEHNLKAVFQRLREKGLTLNKSKCEFKKDKMEFFECVFQIRHLARP